MTRKIEDINWSKMPEGATEFSLEDDEFIFCWFNKKGEFTDLCGTMAWEVLGDDPEDKEDIRKRHKVSDYHPSAKRKPTREERLEMALGALIQSHFFVNRFETVWGESKTLADVDPILRKEIVDLLKMGEKMKNY